MMVAVSKVYQTTRRNIPEDCRLHNTEVERYEYNLNAAVCINRVIHLWVT
jgi:hypothetical protein